jgi:hypothetical protein
LEQRDCYFALDSFDRESFECDDQAIRQAVMCKAWRSPPGDPAEFNRAVRQAWGEVAEKCPETPAPAPAPYESFLINDERGNPAGAVTAYASGEIDICYKGNCRHEFSVPEEQGDVIASMRAILPVFGLTLTPEAPEEE